jgi:hypothetical protein
MPGIVTWNGDTPPIITKVRLTDEPTHEVVPPLSVAAVIKEPTVMVGVPVLDTLKQLLASLTETIENVVFDASDPVVIGVPLT